MLVEVTATDVLVAKLKKDHYRSAEDIKRKSKWTGSSLEQEFTMWNSGRKYDRG